MMENNLQIIGPPRHAFNRSSGGSFQPRFHENETITGKVLKSINDSALLLIKGRQVNVKSQVPLTNGSTITLKVKSLSPVPVLKMLGEKITDGKALNIPVILSALKENIWKLAMDVILHSNQGDKDLTRLLHLIEEAVISESKNPTPELLKLLVSKAGYSLESKLKKAILENNVSKAYLNQLVENDLKGMLLKIIGKNKDNNGTLKRCLSSIENFQILNKDGLKGSGKIFIPIPVQFSDGVFNIGQLLIEQVPWREYFTGEEAPDDEEAYKTTFYLNLSRLGPVRSEVMICRKHVKGIILVEKRKAQKIIKEQIPFFIETLSSRGFDVNCIECFLKDHETVSSPLLPEIIEGENNFICLTA